MSVNGGNACTNGSTAAKNGGSAAKNRVISATNRVISAINGAAGPEAVGDAALHGVLPDPIRTTRWHVIGQISTGHRIAHP
eukprot:743141-Rhodomonas_salina.6